MTPQQIANLLLLLNEFKCTRTMIAYEDEMPQFVLEALQRYFAGPVKQADLEVLVEWFDGCL